MVNLTEEMYELIDEELKVFSCLTPKKKASVILQDFKNSKLNDEKSCKAKTTQEAELYDYHRIRLYTKAQREVGLLSDDEMEVYLGLLQKEISKDLKTAVSFGKLLDKIGIYNSALFLLTEHVDESGVTEPKIVLEGNNAHYLKRVLQSLDSLKQKICDIDRFM